MAGRTAWLSELVKWISHPAFMYASLFVAAALLMFVIMVGQQVLGAASDKRAVVTYQDAEAILHECLQMQEHLGAQDRALDGIVTRMEELGKRVAG